MHRRRMLTISIMLLLVGSTAGHVSPAAVFPPDPAQAASKTACISIGGDGTKTRSTSCDRSLRTPHPAALAPYGTLWSAAVDGKGQVYVLNRANAQLLKLSASGHLLGRWSVPPIHVPNQPADLTGIALGPHHTLYVTDAFNYQLITLTTKGQIIRSWDTSHLMEWRLGGPFGVARDTRGNLYVPNFAFSDVEKYDSSGRPLLTFGHPCPQDPESETTTNPCTDAGHQAPGELNHPDGIAVDRRGNVYVSDHRSRRVVKFAPDGTELTTFGPTLPGAYGSFGLIEGVVVDGKGNIYVEDRGGPRVVKLSPQGEPLAEWRPAPGYAAEGTPGMDGKGNLYLTLNADRQPSVITKLSPDLQLLSRWM